MTKRSPLAPGMKIKFVGGFGAGICFTPYRATITSISPNHGDPIIAIRTDAGETGQIARRQVVSRLIPKPRKEKQEDAMTLQQKLDQLKERMAEKFTADDPCCEGRIHHENTYEAGFTAAAQLLLPLVEALQRSSEYGHEVDCSSREARWGDKGDACDCRYREEKEALSTLERRLSEGGKNV